MEALEALAACIAGLAPCFVGQPDAPEQLEAKTPPRPFSVTQPASGPLAITRQSSTPQQKLCKAASVPTLPVPPSPQDRLLEDREALQAILGGLTVAALLINWRMTPLAQLPALLLGQVPWLVLAALAGAYAAHLVSQTTPATSKYGTRALSGSDQQPNAPALSVHSSAEAPPESHPLARDGSRRSLARSSFYPASILSTKSLMRIMTREETSNGAGSAPPAPPAPASDGGGESSMILHTLRKSLTNLSPQKWTPREETERNRREEKKLSTLSNRNTPSHYGWVRELLEQIARCEPPPVQDADVVCSYGDPLFVVLGACPSIFAGMQAVMYSAMPPRAPLPPRVPTRRPSLDAILSGAGNSHQTPPSPPPHRSPVVDVVEEDVRPSLDELLAAEDDDEAPRTLLRVPPPAPPPAPQEPSALAPRRPAVDFWWIKPQRECATALERCTLRRQNHGPHKNSPGHSAALYAPLAALLDEEAGANADILFGLERTVHGVWRATVRPREQSQCFYLLLVWQEAWTSNVLASTKFIEGKLLYQKSPNGTEYFSCPYRIENAEITVHFEREEVFTDVLPPARFKLGCDAAPKSVVV